MSEAHGRSVARSQVSQRRLEGSQIAMFMQPRSSLGSQSAHRPIWAVEPEVTQRSPPREGSQRWSGLRTPGALQAVQLPPSQKGRFEGAVAVEHWVSLVQPTHSPVDVLQCGAPNKQFVSLVHPTHRLTALHTGALAGQPLDVRHCTHVWVTSLQTLPFAFPLH